MIVTKPKPNERFNSKQAENSNVAEFYMLAGSFFNIWLMDLCFQFRNNANRAS